jgi:hypothetical protein
MSENRSSQGSNQPGSQNQTGSTPPANSAAGTTKDAKAGAAQEFYVDGKPVSEKEWLEAAAANGYDLSRLPPNYRPDISTKKHSAPAQGES